MSGQTPDLMNLLCLDPKFSRSPFGGNHRTIFIERDYTNGGDFVFNNLLQHFGRREPNTLILLVTINHDWLNYSATAAKCGFNLRKKQNMGNIEILDFMEQYLDDACKGIQKNHCESILQQVKQFIDTHSSNSQTDHSVKPLVVMIDDISLLQAIGSSTGDVFNMVCDIESSLRQRSHSIQSGRLSHLIVQSMFTNFKSNQSHLPNDQDLNFLIKNLENTCDINIILRPLETGHSTRVDGIIKIIDYRLPALTESSDDGKKPTMGLSLSMFPNSSADIGSKKAFFFKLSDRRVRLTSDALIF